MKRVNLYLSDLQIKEMGKVIKHVDMNKSDFVRRAIDEYLEKIKKKYKIK
jgi:metal-responsive CopG/Arc/MetJ family transcriptional regulator